jgi:hypothetical protein
MTTWNIAKQRQLDRLTQQHNEWVNNQLPALTQELAQLLGVSSLTTTQTHHIVNNASVIITTLRRYVP